MILLFYAITVRSSYYIGFVGYDVLRYKCDTRDDLVDIINSMDLSIQRLPTITIDEDLELDCNELPMFYYKVATLHRDNTFPTYSFNSNKTDGFAAFTLDTSTSSDDNCPGFSFSNIAVKFKGTSLNTSKMSIGDNVTITSDPGFELNTIISEIPLNFLPIFPNLSFCRLSILPETVQNDQFNYSYLDDIELNLELKYAEAYMFSIDISESTEVLFINQTMYIEIFNKTTIIVHFPEIINYSNAFYFNIISSDISLTISGDINYTDLFPHYLYINQVPYISNNINITLNQGNYFTHEGTCFNTVTGERFSISLNGGNLFWNNTTPILAVVLAYTNLYILSDLKLERIPSSSTTFAYYSEIPIFGNISIECDTLILPYHIEPSDGNFFNITARQTGDMVDFEGDLYITSLLANEVNVTNLFFVDEPLINLKNNRNPIRCNEVHGKVKISPYTTGSVGTIKQILCANVVDSIKVENFIIESDYGDAFQPVLLDGCLCVNKTKSTTQNPTIYVINEEFKWTDNYESFQKKITFVFSTENYVLDLTVFGERSQMVSIVLQASKSCTIEIVIDQKSADMIENIQIGSSTTPLNITWSDQVSLHCDITVYKCCNILSLFEDINLTNMGTITLKDFTQLNEIETIADNFECIVLSTTTKVKNLTFTSTGWRVYTSDLPEDEELEINGFNHPNILLPITSSNVFGPMFSRMMNIGLETTTPFPLYISFSTNVAVYLLNDENWEKIDDFQPIILVTGTVTLFMQFEVLPINFDDFKFSNVLNRGQTRSVLINRANGHVQRIISSYSVFDLDVTLSISTASAESSLYIEINKEATIHGAAKITHPNYISIVFRNKLNLDSSGTQRMWRESNSIYMYNTSTLLSPSFMDDISIVWKVTNDRNQKPSMIESAVNVNLFKFIFDNVSDVNISEKSERFFNQPFMIANAVIDISCEELSSRLVFVDDRKSFNFSNKVISFEVICIDLIYSTHPVQFSLNGFVPSGFPSHIALFLNRTLNENDNLNVKSKGKTEIDPGVIACIIIGACTAVVIVVSLSVYFVKRRRHSIENLVLQ